MLFSLSKKQYSLKKNNKFYFISPQQVILFHCTCLKSLIFVVFTRAICLSQTERAFQWPRYHEAVGSTSSPLWWLLVRNSLPPPPPILPPIPPHPPPIPPRSLNNSPLKFYSPGWREALWEPNILPKNTLLSLDPFNHRPTTPTPPLPTSIWSVFSFCLFACFICFCFFQPCPQSRIGDLSLNLPWVSK